MARRCSICDHQRQQEIDHDLMGSKPLREIAAAYRVAQSSLHRHKTNHLIPRAASALARHEEIDLERLLSWMTGLQDRASAGIIRCTTEGDMAGVRAFIKEVRENVALMAKLKGYVDGPAQVHIDARKQTAVLAGVETDDLRALATAAREGRLDGVLSERTGVPVVEG